MSPTVRVDGYQITTDDPVTLAQARDLIAAARAADQLLGDTSRRSHAMHGWADAERDADRRAETLLERRHREQLVLREREDRDRAVLAERPDPSGERHDRATVGRERDRRRWPR